MFYAFWTDIGCRTWGSCTITKNPAGPAGPHTTLYARHGHTPNSAPSVSAQESADGNTVVVRIVNTGNEPKAVALSVAGFSKAAGSELTASTTNDANPSWAPDKISPREIQVQMSTAGAASLTLAPISYTVVVASK